jgi:hypothetical protein
LRLIDRALQENAYLSWHSATEQSLSNTENNTNMHD